MSAPAPQKFIGLHLDDEPRPRSTTLAKAEGMLRGIADAIDDEAALREENDDHDDTVLRGFAVDLRECIRLLEQAGRS